MSKADIRYFNSFHAGVRASISLNQCSKLWSWWNTPLSAYWADRRHSITRTSFKVLTLRQLTCDYFVRPRFSKLNWNLKSNWWLLTTCLNKNWNLRCKYVQIGFIKFKSHSKFLFTKCQTVLQSFSILRTHLRLFSDAIASQDSVL